MAERGDLAGAPTPPEGSAPGWYVDPLGVGAARYWDGNKWSERYRDAPGPDRLLSGETAKFLRPPAAASVPTGLLVRWRRLPKGAKIAIVVVVGIIVISIASSGGGKKPSASSQNAAAASSEPSVSLHLNQGGFSTQRSSAVLTGNVTLGAEVQVNGHVAHVHGDRWVSGVGLPFGDNSVTVVASMAGHHSAENTITVTRNHTRAELAAEAQANKEREQREHQANREREERERRAEQAKKEIEGASASQQNALHAAENYLETSAFSRAGLIEQLSSEAGDKYPEQDAVWAVEHLPHVDWNEQAAKAAKNYLSTSSFSCQGMIEQLSSGAGDKYTVAQAEYGAKQVGLC